MIPSPAFNAFSETYEKGVAQVVTTQLLADLETPVSAMIKLVKGAPDSFLLESVEGGSIRGRYSFLGMKPDLIWRCSGDMAEINRNALLDRTAFTACPVGADGGVLASFRALLAESRIDLPDGMAPMAAGLFGYMGYDMVRLAEDIPNENPTEIEVPDGQYMRPTIIAVFDTIEDLVTVVTPVRPEDGVSAEAAYEAACDRLDQVVADFNAAQPLRHDVEEEGTRLEDVTSNMTADAFCDIVEKGKESGVAQ